MCVCVCVQFMSETQAHWYLGVDNSGDLTHWENAVGFIDEVKTDMKTVDLVSSGGLAMEHALSSSERLVAYVSL